MLATNAGLSCVYDYFCEISQQLAQQSETPSVMHECPAGEASPFTIDHPSPDEMATAPAIATTRLPAEKILSNGVLLFLQQMTSAHGQFKFFGDEVCERVIRVLEEPLESENSLFVNSLREWSCVEEYFGVFQQLFSVSPLIKELLFANAQLLRRMFKVTMY